MPERDLKRLLNGKREERKTPHMTDSPSQDRKNQDGIRKNAASESTPE